MSPPKKASKGELFFAREKFWKIEIKIREVAQVFSLDELMGSEVKVFRGEEGFRGGGRFKIPMDAVELGLHLLRDGGLGDKKIPVLNKPLLFSAEAFNLVDT